MVRMADLPENNQKRLMRKEGPVFDSRPWVTGPPLNKRRVALCTTAGLHLRSDPPFQKGQPVLYRVIPGDISGDQIVMSHNATSFDRTGYQQDWNVVFPLDRLRELVAEGVIGSTANFHYSFGTPLTLRENEIVVAELSALLKNDGVNAVLLFPV